MLTDIVETCVPNNYTVKVGHCMPINQITRTPVGWLLSIIVHNHSNVLICRKSSSERFNDPPLDSHAIDHCEFERRSVTSLLCILSFGTRPYVQLLQPTCTPMCRHIYNWISLHVTLNNQSYSLCIVYLLFHVKVDNISHICICHLKGQIDVQAICSMLTYRRAPMS